MDLTDLKVRVSSDVEKKVIDWLVVQIQTALQDRKQTSDRWKKWIKQYEEELPLKKNFPWPGCSNLSLPETAIAVETIHAREVNTLFSVRPYIQIKPKKIKTNKQYCLDLERFIDQIYQHVVDLYKVGSSWFLEKTKMGTGYVKVYWNYDQKKRRKGNDYVYDTNDDVKVDVLNIEDLIFPVNAIDLETCSFVSHRKRTNWPELSRKEKLKMYENTDKIEAFYRTDTVTRESGEDIQRVKEDAEKMVRTSPDVLKEYEIHEVWFDYDIDDDGFAERTVMTLELDSREKLRWIHHPYNHGRRPFIPCKYMERVNRVAGKGICEMGEFLQDGANTTVNQAIDNATIANAKIFVASKTAKEDIPKDGLYPGLTIYLDSPGTDLKEFMMGDIHQSDFALLGMFREYLERRTKVNDYTLGRQANMGKNRATATGTLALLQESGRSFDMVVNNSRAALVEVTYQVVELYAQYRPDKIFEVVGSRKPITLVEKVMSALGKSPTETITLPGDLNNLREDYEFYCAATSLSVNKEIEKQTNLLLLQQLGGLFQQMLQMLMMVENEKMQLPPDVKKFILGIISSYYNMAQDLIRSFEKVDIASYLPELPDIVKQAYGQGGDGQDMQAIMQKIGGMINAQGGNTAGMAGPGIPPGMEAPLPELQGIARPGMVKAPGPQ